jgi:hypothetical protein
MNPGTPTLLVALDETVKRYRRPWRARALAIQVVRTAEEARSALQEDARFDAWDPLFVDIAVLGRARLLAGEADAAREALERATRACGALFDPFTEVRAHLWLGSAHEARRDTPAACAAYAEVLRRWGTETPLAKTAQAAKARRAALRCHQ